MIDRPNSPAASDVGDALRARSAGRLSALDWVDACLRRIGERDDAVRAWVHVDRDGARAAARRIDEATGPLAPLSGMPVGVKDVIDVAGLPTGCNSPTQAGRVAAVHAASVARLVAAGAVPLGKTVTTEFAFTEPGPTRNPHDSDRTPGGSSSGSAAAVADFQVPVALTTQTGGSTIRPAAFCGVVGYKPPFGHVPTPGLMYLAPSLDTIGLHARSIADLARVAEVLEARPRPIDRSRVPAYALVRLPGDETCEPAVRAALAWTVDALRAAGAAVHERCLVDEFGALDAAHRVIMSVEVARSFAVLRTRAAGQLSADLLAFIARGEAVTGDELATAAALVARVRQSLYKFAEAGEVLLTPATPGVAPVGLHTTGNAVFNRPFSLLHMGALTVPAGVGTASMPIGIQLADPHPSADHLFDAAAFAESVLARRPSVFQEPPRERN
jgi:Asp-tRNA(Asn)/Glu-tRNA(Gln) amidotransferase A subunit family amidase